jgi:4-hydroxybenzoate polyprenyltransferase
MTWAIALRLGRVSNLPTVWSNTLVGVVLAGGTVADPRTGLAMLALSLFYIAGMFLNDAFDREIDARERPERPIPSGQVTAGTVFGAGFVMMALGLVLLLWVGYGFAGGTGWAPAAAGLWLGAAIVYYDWHHKNNPLSPFWMGVCRMLVYIAAGVALSPAPPVMLLVAALLLLSYLIGLTYVAKQENLGEVRNLWPLAFLALPALYGVSVATGSAAGAVLCVAFIAWVLYALSFLRRRQPGDVPRAVVSLIAGISLLDALFIAGAGAPMTAGLAVVAFALTLAFQRYIPGT